MKKTQNALFDALPDVINIHQLREALGIGRKGAYKLLEEKRIPCFKVGNAYRIPKSALIEYVNEEVRKNDR